MARIDKIKKALSEMEANAKIGMWNEYCSEQGNEDEIFDNDEDFFANYLPEPFNAVQRAIYGDYNPMHDFVVFDGYGNLKSLDDYQLDKYIDDDALAQYISENEDNFDYFLDEIEEDEPNEVSEEQYYDALEVLPPFYFDVVNGKKVSGGFAVGEPTSHKQTPLGMRATYSGYYKSGDKYFGLGQVYFVIADEQGEPDMNLGNDDVEVKTLDPEAFKTGGTTGRKPKLKKSDRVAIYGSRWFDRTYGNTYHTSQLYVNDELIETSPLTYGYDEGYLDTGLKMLEKHYTLPTGYRTDMRWRLRDFIKSFVYRATDVSRKRDLYATGGGVRMVNGREYPTGRAWTNDHNHEDKSSDYEVPQADRKKQFETGGELTAKQKTIDLNKNGRLDAEDFAMLRASMNGAWRNERKYVDHSNKREVKYAKKTGSVRTGYKGRKEYETGGKSELPHYKVGDEIFVDFQDAMDFCDEQNLSYDEIIKTKQYKTGGSTGSKVYYEESGIGSSKYVVNFHDGKKTHSDGSPFYDIRLYRSKEQKDKFVKELKADGYKEKYSGGGSTDKPKEPIAFETSNLYFNSFGKDINGNSVVRVSFPNSRAFSIQLNNGSFSKTYKPFGQSGFSDIDETEINEYVREYGSPAQKKKLKIYKK